MSAKMIHADDCTAPLEDSHEVCPRPMSNAGRWIPVSLYVSMAGAKDRTVVEGLNRWFRDSGMTHRVQLLTPEQFVVVPPNGTPRARARVAARVGRLVSNKKRRSKR